MFGASEFGPDFQRTLIRTCVDDGGLRRLVGKFVEAGQLAFTDPASAWGWSVLAAARYPTLLVLQTEARRVPDTDPARAGVHAILSADDWRGRQYVADQIVEWARKQTFMAGFEEAREAWNAGKSDDAYDVMQRRMDEMRSIRLEVADRGWFFEGFEERQERRRIVAEGMDFFPLGIDRIDKAMHGGLSYTELEVPLAYSGIGKSFYCTMRGVLCVRSRRRVLHFVLEGGRAKQEDRYEAAFTESMYREVRRGDFNAPAMRLIQREYAIYKGLMVVRGFASAEEQWRITIDEIMGELDTLRKGHGWVPDMIIVDYGDLLHAPGKDDRERQKAGFRQLKALAETHLYRGHHGFAVCAPSQAVRPEKGADEKEHVLKPRDVADSYEKVRVADAIISINRTTQEKENDQARVSLGKYRDAEDGVLVRITTDYDHGLFVKLGAPEPPPMAPPAS